MARRYADDPDRPTKLPENYDFPPPCGPGCCHSALAACATHKIEFIGDFLRWASLQSRIKDNDDSLHDWCAQRFGGRLYPAAFSVLRFELKVALYGDPYKLENRRQAPRAAVLSNADPSFLEKAIRSMPEATLFANEEVL